VRSRRGRTRRRQTNRVRAGARGHSARAGAISDPVPLPGAGLGESMKTAIIMFALAVAMPPTIALADDPPAEGAVIHGTVRDAATGKPVPGASVYRQETDEVAITDEDGRFTFAPGGPATSHLAVVDPSYQRADIHTDAKSAADIVLVPLTL